jgi:hypothetical protein
VLLSADRVGTMAIQRHIGKSKPTISRWQERFMAAGVDGLLRDATRPGRGDRLPCAHHGVAQGNKTEQSVIVSRASRGERPADAAGHVRMVDSASWILARKRIPVNHGNPDRDSQLAPVLRPSSLSWDCR